MLNLKIATNYQVLDIYFFLILKEIINDALFYNLFNWDLCNYELYHVE